MKIVSGNSNLPLSESVARRLEMSLAKALIKRFSDNEVFLEIQENVRGEDVFVIQSTSHPANDNLMELLITLDALKRGSARRITAVVPYFGYGRQDRKTSPRSPISAKLCANLMTVAGAHRVLTFDLHSAQIQGFFDIPVDNLFASPVFSKDLIERFGKGNITLVSPDVGAVGRTRSIAKRVEGDLAIIDKRRERAGVSEVVHVIGDVQGRICVLVDDIVDSGGTLCNAALSLKEKGAEKVYAYVTHGVLSGDAVHKIERSPIEELIITDSIQATDLIHSSEKINQLSIAPLLAEAVLRISEERSVSSLFD